MTEVYIYALLDIELRVRYIGKSLNPYKRFQSHVKEKVWPAQFVIIDICSEFNWKQQERYWIKFYREIGCPLENRHKGGAGWGIHNALTGKKISLSLRGRSRPDWVREKISKGNRGQIRSEESKLKMSIAAKNRSDWYWTGKHLPEEMKLKISATQKGRPPFPHGEEGIRKIKEARANQIPPMLGKVHSEETRRKMSLSAKNRKEQNILNRN